MKKDEIIKIRKSLEKSLDAKRYEHSLGVAYISSALAMRYGADISKALVAGYLHDCAKCLSDEKKLSICKKNNIEISEAEKNKPCLLHAKVGSFLAKKEYGIEDEDILNAITYHTTGRPGMSILEKIVYLADYIEPGRKLVPNLEKIRTLAFQDMDEALLLTLENIIRYLQETGETMDTFTLETYNYYRKE